MCDPMNPAAPETTIRKNPPARLHSIAQILAATPPPELL
jgi:hypothetical protein